MRARRVSTIPALAASLCACGVVAALPVSPRALAQDAQPAAPAAERPAPPVTLLLEDAFDAPLDDARWESVRVHDTRADRIATERGRLALALDTLGTDDATVKLRGVRSRAAFELGPDARLRVTATLDWNDPANGCYLTAGVALVPEDHLDPRAAPDALAFEFVGVPPGRNARPSLWRRAAGALQPLYTEGWPQPRREDRVGRHVKRARIELEASAREVRLAEDGVERHAGPGGIAGRVRVLLFVTGHSNYGERAVLFEDVRVEQIGP